MLNEIPSPDFALTRDFLVMQDEQINIVNSLRTTTSELNTEQNIVLSEMSSISVVQEPIVKCVNKIQGINTISSDEFLHKNIQENNNNFNDNESHKKPFCKYASINQQ